MSKKQREMLTKPKTMEETLTLSQVKQVEKKEKANIWVLQEMTSVIKLLSNQLSNIRQGKKKYGSNLLQKLNLIFQLALIMDLINLQRINHLKEEVQAVQAEELNLQEENNSLQLNLNIKLLSQNT